jgi:TolB protein
MHQMESHLFLPLIVAVLHKFIAIVLMMLLLTDSLSEVHFNARGTLSADGKNIALVHRPSGSNYKVAIMNINTGIVNILTPTSLDESPSFSPNGQMVVYATREGNRGLLSVMSTDGRFRMNLPSEQGEVREPAWAPK